MDITFFKYLYRFENTFDFLRFLFIYALIYLIIKLVIYLEFIINNMFLSNQEIINKFFMRILDTILMRLRGYG